MLPHRAQIRVGNGKAKEYLGEARGQYYQQKSDNIMPSILSNIPL